MKVLVSSEHHILSGESSYRGSVWSEIFVLGFVLPSRYLCMPEEIKPPAGLSLATS